MSGTVIPLGPHASIYLDDKDVDGPRRVLLQLPEVTIDLSWLPLEWHDNDDSNEDAL